MKKMVVVAMALMMSIGMSFGLAQAEPTLQQVLDSITVVPFGNSSTTVGTDEVQPDAYWSIGGSGASVTTFVIEITANDTTQAFGIYDMIGGETVQIFSGASVQGSQALVSILNDGSVIVNFSDTGVDFNGNAFGFYLNPDGIGTTYWFSDSDLNPDSYDAMWAYQGEGDTIEIPPFSPGTWTANEYILAWEDGGINGDGDHNDMVVLVESVTPKGVPEPATMLLLGSGLLGLGLIRRRKQVR